MKLLNRKEFLNTPIYTIFSYYNEKSFMEWDDLLIKGEGPGYYSNDFSCMSLYKEIGFEFSSDGMDNQLEAEKRLEDGKSINLDEDCYGRDGMFEDKERYIVFEKDDIEKMIRNLQRGLQ